MNSQASTCDELAMTAAKILLDTNAVTFRPQRPFVFSSGWASPVFVDCKQVVSYPLAREALIELSIKRILAKVGYQALDGIAGAEGGGVPFAAIIADRLHLPLVVARKQAMGIGPDAQMTGSIRDGARLLLVDDLTTDGRTKIEMSGALRRAGATVSYAYVVFKYGIFDAVSEPETFDIELLCLATWRELLAVAEREGAFSDETMRGIREYVSDPLAWSARHGGRGYT